MAWIKVSRQSRWAIRLAQGIKRIISVMAEQGEGIIFGYFSCPSSHIVSGSYRGGAYLPHFCLGRRCGFCLPWHHRGGTWDVSGRIPYGLACLLGDLQRMGVTRNEARVTSVLGALSSHVPRALTASLFPRAAAVPSGSSGSTRALGPSPLTKSPSRQMSSSPLRPQRVSTR